MNMNIYYWLIRVACAIRVVLLAYPRLLVFLLAIMIPTCDSSNPAFHMMYFAYKLNKQSDKIQPWHTPLSTWNQSIAPWPVLTVASWPAYRILRRQIRCYGILISLRILQGSQRVRHDWATELNWTDDPHS